MRCCLPVCDVANACEGHALREVFCEGGQPALQAAPNEGRRGAVGGVLANHPLQGPAWQVGRWVGGRSECGVELPLPTQTCVGAQHSTNNGSHPTPLPAGQPAPHLNMVRASSAWRLGRWWPPPSTQGMAPVASHCM